MTRILTILILISNVACAQTHEKFFSEFLLENNLNSKNEIKKYQQYDFSDILTVTENRNILGILGKDHQRLKIKIITVQKNPNNPNQYLIEGKSCVNSVICDFNGTITIKEIKELKGLHFGVDDDYADKGIKSQGILIADYEFKENPKQKHNGTFNGVLYSKWYMSEDNKINYDNIQSISDGYSNNAFIGIWQSNATGKKKICNWGDYRVPNANQDFDNGAAEFSPAEKYLVKGWQNYQDAWLYGNENAQKEELKEWWK